MGDFFEEPEVTEVTSLSDNTRSYITSSPLERPTYIYGTPVMTSTSYPHTWNTTTLGSPYVWTPDTYEGLMRRTGKEEELKVKIDEIKSSYKGEHILACQNKEDLAPERILITLSAVKGKLMFETAPIHIKEIQCSMTPKVRDNIILASKKLRMYGKKSPIIPSFDEYGNRLPDVIEIGDNNGITVRIVDPEDYGELYFELKAIEFPSPDYDTTRDWTYIGDDDLPF